MHDESKLPKWAQRKLDELRMEISRLQVLGEAHAVLMDREWFTLFDAQDRFTLYRFVKDAPVSLCAIGVGDVALIGRAKPKETR